MSRFLRPSQGDRLREDIADALMTDTAVSNAFSPEERAMLHNILRFREVRVEDIMVPRADIEGIDESMSIGELMILFERSGRSRMPVYATTLDDPRGMVHIRDLLSFMARQARGKCHTEQRISGNRMHGETTGERFFDLSQVNLGTTVLEAGIIRKVLFVPPSMLASDLMQSMQAARTQMALVIDEYGGTDGLVSHEDIVEMVIGDVDDEHDHEEIMVSRLSDDVFIADARVELEEIAEAIGPDFDIRDSLEDVDTLGGLIFSSLGHIPTRGEIVDALPGFSFQILDSDQRRIKRVRITRRSSSARPLTVVADGPADQKSTLDSRASNAPAANGYRSSTH